jgi:hypothetical protein
MGLSVHMSYLLDVSCLLDVEEDSVKCLIWRVDLDVASQSEQGLVGATLLPVSILVVVDGTCCIKRDVRILLNSLSSPGAR